MLYRVKVPVHGTAKAHQPSTIFPRGTLLERLPHHDGVFIRVRCKGEEYCVLEQELTQRCERVMIGPPGGWASA